MNRQLTMPVTPFDSSRGVRRGTRSGQVPLHRLDTAVTYHTGSPSLYSSSITSPEAAETEKPCRIGRVARSTHRAFTAVTRNSRAFQRKAVGEIAPFSNRA